MASGCIVVVGPVGVGKASLVVRPAAHRVPCPANNLSFSRPQGRPRKVRLPIHSRAPLLDAASRPVGGRRYFNPGALAIN